MKTIACAALLFFSFPLFAKDWTNTVLTEKLDIRSYRVVRYLSSGKSGRLITREIETSDGKKLYYFIDTGTLRYGLTDNPEKTGPATNLANTELGNVFQRQLAKLRPYGTFNESFKPESNKNIVLTTDLCPTPNDFDRQFYSDLQSLAADHKTSIPLVVFISGDWARNHPEQLGKIKSSGLNLIAGNHTFRHHILTNAQNIAVFTAELTNTEATLLANGVLPSYFFRFPGLIYHPAYMRTLDKLSIVAVSANVWMGTKAKNWGILLVHSNGCASSEVRIFAKFLKNNRNDILRKKLDFRDIYSYFQITLAEKKIVSNH